MHAVLHKEITVGKATLSRISHVLIKRSTTAVVDTCTIKVPTQMVLVAKDGTITKGLTANAVNVGDEVIVNLWYNDRKENKEFHGFVKRKNYNQLVEIECEDFCWLLRDIKLKKTYVKTSLKSVLNDVLSQVKPTESGITLKLSKDCDDIDLTNLAIAGKFGEALSGLQVLQFLKDKFGISIYFNLDGELYAGMAYKQNIGNITYKMGLNVIRQECQLKYRLKDDIKLKIKCVSIDPSGTRTEANLGDDGGSERTVVLYDVKDKANLEKLAKNMLTKYKYDGYEGTIKTFLQPQVFPANTAILSDAKYPDRDGDYYVELVVTEFGTGGARRTLSLGPKVSSL